MVGPPPGSTPNSEPIAVPRSAGFHASRKSWRLGQTLPILAGASGPWPRFSANEAKISAMPNKPIATGMKPTPSIRFGMPNVKRSAPVSWSVPTVDNRMPTSTMQTAFNAEPRASMTTATSPKVMSAKYSAAPNAMATRASGGEATTMSSVATVPAKNDPSAEIASAAPARPWRAIW
jgi:hypothetical protein